MAGVVRRSFGGRSYGGRSFGSRSYGGRSFRVFICARSLVVAPLEGADGLDHEDMDAGGDGPVIGADVAGPAADTGEDVDTFTVQDGAGAGGRSASPLHSDIRITGTLLGWPSKL